MARVYVSSTSSDLENERAAVIEVIRRLGHTPVAMEDYNAGDRPPLDKCLEDVRTCHIYVGILGWCYGSCPPGSKKSFTQLEYEAAVARKKSIKRLIFFSPPLDAWKGKQDAKLKHIKKFRKLVLDEKLGREFKDPSYLAKEVALSFNEHVPRVVRIPELLPFDCDRKPQKIEIARQVRDPGPDGSLPHVIILHGDLKQAHAKFIKCARQRYIPEVLDQIGERRPVQEYELSWPDPDDADDFGKMLVEDLAYQVCKNPDADRDAIAAKLSLDGAPVLITVCLRTGVWSASDHERLRDFCRLWLEWERHVQCRPMMVMLYAQYRGTSAGPDGPPTSSDLRNRQIEEAIKGLPDDFDKNPRLSVAPRLKDVPFSDVHRWSEQDAINELCGEIDLTDEIVQLTNSEPYPMVPLAEGLAKILEEHLDARRSR